MVKLNNVKERFLFLSPTVQAGWEDESNIGDFNLVKALGKGAFGRVSKAVHKRSQLIYAIKEINKKTLKETNMVDQVVNEVKIMYALNHPNIVKLYNHFEDDVNIYLVMEYATGGQLYQVLWKQPNKRFQEKKTAQIILQLCQALEKCHQASVIHSKGKDTGMCKDIKPENILLDANNNIKLADFGWSNFLISNSSDVRDTFCGTLDYLAPEMLTEQHSHDFNVDIWAVGVLTYELSSGLSPFAPRERMHDAAYVDKMTRQNIKSVKISFPEDFPPLAKDFVQKILQKDPKDRPSLQAIMNHNWITTNCGIGPTSGTSSAASSVALKEKEIVKVSEIEDCLKNGKAIFTHDQIYSYSRPDSIINKPFEEQNKTAPNFFKAATKQGGVSGTSESALSQHLQGQGAQASLPLAAGVTEDLKRQLRELEHRVNQATLDNKKLTQENEQLKEELTRTRQELQNSGGGGGVGADKYQTLLAKEREKYASLKKENDYQWQKYTESEKKVKDYKEQIELLQSPNVNKELQIRMNEYKSLYETTLQQLQKVQQELSLQRLQPGTPRTVGQGVQQYPPQIGQAQAAQFGHYSEIDSILEQAKSQQKYHETGYSAQQQNRKPF